MYIAVSHFYPTEHILRRDQSIGEFFVSAEAEGKVAIHESYFRSAKYSRDCKRGRLQRTLISLVHSGKGRGKVCSSSDLDPVRYKVEKRVHCIFSCFINGTINENVYL